MLRIHLSQQWYALSDPAREEEVYGDSGYTGAEHFAELQDVKAAFLIAEKPSKLRAIKNKRDLKHARRWERFTASWPGLDG